MVDLLREADEALKQERMERFWKENGKTVLGFMALTVLATGGISAYKSWDAGRRAKATDAALTLVEDPAFPSNADKAGDMPAGLRALVWLKAAGLHRDKGENDQAVALYDRVIQDGAAPEDLKDLASLLRAGTGAGQDADKTLSSLEAVAAGKGPWRAEAALAAAAILAAKGDFAAAHDRADSVRAMDDVPGSLQGRAAALARVYGLRQEKGEKQP